MILLLSLSGCASAGHIVATVIGIIAIFIFCAGFEKSGVAVFIVVGYLMISNGSCQEMFRDPAQVQKEYEQKRLEELDSDPHYEFLRKKREKQKQQKQQKKYKVREIKPRVKEVKGVEWGQP